jgi:hypothetical protein
LNIYEARLTKLSPIIEEEVTCVIHGLEVTAFCTVSPYPIHEDDLYPVALSFVSFDGLDIRESPTPVKNLVRKGNGYGYLIQGELNDGVIDFGLQVFDEELKECSHLSGKYVEFLIDRLQIEFLESEDGHS